MGHKHQLPAGLYAMVPVLLFLIAISVSSSLQAGDIWEMMKPGGKVILMRHLPVEQHPDPVKRDINCQTEQKLSLEGKQLGKQLAEKFNRQKIDIGSVYASPYCRTTETAELVFDKSEALASLQLVHSLDADTAEKHRQSVSHLIGNYRGKSNLVLVTHRPNIAAITFEQLDKGGFVLLTPTGDGDFEEEGVFSP